MLFCCSPVSIQQQPFTLPLPQRRWKTKRYVVRPQVVECSSRSTESTLPDLNALWSCRLLNRVPGVPDVGTEKCKISLFESDTGDRGVFSVADIERDEKILRMPLRLAILDHRDDKPSVQWTYEGAPWSVRLACKLLREKALGELSPWSPFVQSLPREIECVLRCFSYEDIKAIEYEDIKGEIDHYVWMVVDAWQRLKPEAHGNSTRDEFEWAMSVVHSRTFGTAGKSGPNDVHMLLPLVDMFNHGGDVCHGLLKEPHKKADSVEWEIHPLPEPNMTEWEITLTASSSIPADEQVLMSYGERNNDDFFLFYGFVPPLNPKDDYVLFPNLHEAVDWYFLKYLPEGDPSSLAKLKGEAIAAAFTEEGDIECSQDEELQTRQQAQEVKVRVVAGGFVDGRLVVAFDVLRSTTQLSVNSAVAERCWELLSTKSHLLDDLQLLAECIPASEHNFPFLHKFYSNALSKYQEAGGKLPSPSQQQPHAKSDITFSTTLTKTYMVYKKLILWDILLGLYRT